jgi:hypothetical protein
MKHYIILPLHLLFTSILTTNAQWVQVSSGMGNLTVNALASGENNIFAGVSNGVYLSTNNGTNISDKWR